MAEFSTTPPTPFVRDVVYPDTDSNLVRAEEQLVLPWIMILGRDLAYEETIHGRFRSGEKVLYVGAGLSTFPIEGRTRGVEVTAVDKLFHLEPDQIEEHFRETIARWRKDPQAGVLDQDGHVRGHVAHEQRTRVADKGAILEVINRFESNADAFIADFRARKGATYLPAMLPDLSEISGKFDRVVMSNLLNAYSDEAGPQQRGVHFSHRDTLRSFLRLLELVGSQGEISVFPHTTGRHKRAPYAAALEAALAERGFVSSEQPVGKIDFVYPTPHHWRSVLRIKARA